MKKVLLLSIVLVLTAFACNGTPKLAQDRILELKGHKYSVQLADTPDKRAQGLSGLKSINDTEGMLFLFSEPQILKFWMRGVYFPIDILWINGNQIVDITENVQTELTRGDSELTIYSPHQPADKVLEVNSGWSLRHDIKVGDTFVISP